MFSWPTNFRNCNESPKFQWGSNEDKDRTHNKNFNVSASTMTRVYIFASPATACGGCGPRIYVGTGGSFIEFHLTPRLLVVGIKDYSNLTLSVVLNVLVLLSCRICHVWCRVEIVMYQNSKIWQKKRSKCTNSTLCINKYIIRQQSEIFQIQRQN